MNKIYSFDYIRAISIIGIVLCHFSYNFCGTQWLGNWLGNTFIALFLIMSAVLLGLSWSGKGKPKYGFAFLKHRFVRLSGSYYIFLILMFSFCFLVGGYSLGVKDVLMHFMYLPWFDKIDGFGHLWFVTMIILCYLSLVCITRLELSQKKSKVLLYFLLILCSLFLQCILTFHGLPGYMFYYLTLYVIVFLEAPSIMEFLRKISWLYLFAFVVITVFTLVVAKCGLGSEYLSVDKLSGIVSALCLLFIFLKVFNTAGCNKLASFVAGISFEIYLVHHVFAFGRFSVMNITNIWPLALALLIVGSIFAGWILNKLSKLTLKLLYD